MAYPNLDIGGTRLTLYLEQARRCMTSLSSEFYREKSAGGNAYNGIVNVNHRLETTAGAMDGQSKFLVALADCNTSLVINGDAYNVGKVAFRAGDQVVLSGGAGADHTGTVQEVKINKGAAYNQVEITLSAASGATDFTAIEGTGVLELEITWDEAVTVDTSGGTPTVVVANNDASGGGYGNHTLAYTATGSTANRIRFEKTSASLGNTDVLTVGGANIVLNSGTIKDTADGTTNSSLDLSGVAFSRTVLS